MCRQRAVKPSQQRVDRFHTYARIVIVNKRIEQRLLDDVLRLRSGQRFSLPAPQ